MRIVLAIFIILFLGFSRKQERIYITFQQIFGIIQKCEGENIAQQIKIETNSNLPVKIYDFDLDTSCYSVSYKGQNLNTSNEIELSAKNVLELSVNFKHNKNKNSKLKFKSSHDKSITYEIDFDFDKFYISSNEIREKTEQTISFDRNCIEKINVVFPSGGTVSWVSLYKESSIEKEPVKSISYRWGDEEKNEIEFTKKDTGKYFVKFGSCHWGGDFWLTVK